MVQLIRLGNLGIFAENVPGEVMRCVFFVPRKSTPASILTLDEALQAGGLLILTPATDSFGAILDASTRIFGKIANHAAIVWYSASDVPPESARRLEFDARGNVSKYTAADFIEKAIGDVQSIPALMFLGPTAEMNAARLVVRDDKLSILCKAGEWPLRCVIDGNRFNLAPESILGGMEQIAAIRFDGSQHSGSWLFEFVEKDMVAALRNFLPGMSYVFEDEYGGLKCESFRLFDLDVANPLVGVSSLQVVVNAYDTDVSGNYIELRLKTNSEMILASNFTTRRGNQVNLTTTTAARMLFTPNPNGLSFMLTPTGIFGIQAPSTSFDALHGTRTVDILLGSSGTEYVTFANALGHPTLPHAIEFVSGCPAFAEKVGDNYQLTDRSITAYARPSWGLGASESRTFSYVVQSEEMPLFGAPRFDNVRLFAESTGLPFAAKPRAISYDKGHMPWLPMRNANRDSATLFDRVVASSARRQIAEIGAPKSLDVFDTGPENWTVTPQGFLVQVSEDGRWQFIRVAQERDNDISVEFKRPDRNAPWFLEQALSRPSSFLVATRSPKSSNGRDELGKLEVGANGWKLSCDFTATSAVVSRRPILIAKFGPGKITDLLKNTDQWALSDKFNDLPSQTQSDATNAIAALETLVKGQSPLESGADLPDRVCEAYGRLLAKLNDPRFNGIVILNAESFLDQLPDGVIALAAGESANFGTLLVPIMGVDISRVDTNMLQKPSVFGAIHHYTKDDVKDPKEKGYALKLQNIDTHIENTKLTSFVAKARMWTGSLMGNAMKGEKGDDAPPIIDIEGHYNSKAAEGSRPQYLIQAVGNQRLNFTSSISKYLQSIKITRLELISSRPEPDLISGRISLRGEVLLGTSLVDFCGMKSFKFEDLALTIMQRGKDSSFGFDAGTVSVDWDSSNAESAVKGWLNSFPLRLSGLRWSGMGSLDGGPSSRALSWPDIGFSSLDLNFPDFPDLIMKAPAFDFGLEFDLNLGGFGGQTDAAKVLRAKFILGWYDFRRGLPNLDPFGLGFRFEGGSTPLDVGIQGVFRLRAKSVILKTYDEGKLIGFGLDEPRLDVMGYEIPKDAKVQLAIVVEAQKPSIQPTWIFVSRGFEAAPLSLDYFAIGQNARMIKDGVLPANTLEAVEKSDQWVRDSFDNDLGRLRPVNPQGSKWGLAASGKLKDVVGFEVIFMDTISMYGLRLEIPDEKPFFMADVLYRKISENLGMFSVEIDPNLPQIEFGVGSLTLPILGLDKLTNGGGGINLGYNGNDFSKAGTFQAIPFLGSLGAKVGQYTGLSSAFLLAGATEDLVTRYTKLDLSPVHEVQLAFRLGFGKEIRQSIFSAGVSLTVYGLFQGALAKVNNPPKPNPNDPSVKPIKQYIKIAGAAGVLLEIYGYIDFALISAAVCIRAWVEIGFVIETWQPIEVYGEAGVSVYVKFVIARFKVLGRSFEIAVHYSFETRVRFGQTLGSRLGGNPPEEYRLDVLMAPGIKQAPVQPIDWVELKLDNGVVWTLPLVPSMDVICDDAGAASVLPLLTLHNPAPHGRAPQATGDSVIDLAIGLLRWAVRLHLRTHASDPLTITRNEIEDLQARLRSSNGAPTSRWMAQDLSGTTTRPLDAAAIKAFFASNYRFILMDAKAAKAQIRNDFQERADATGDLQVIVFPWLREIEVHALTQTGGGKRRLRTFHIQNPSNEFVTPDWEANLKDVLSKGRPQYPKDNALLLLLENEGSVHLASAMKKSPLDLMLEDWTDAVIETLIGDALTLLPESKDKKVDFNALVVELRSNGKDGAPPLALQAAQRASSVLLHGLRVPAISGPQWMSISAFAGLDIPFSSRSGANALHDGENVGLEVAVKLDNDWLKGSTALAIEHDNAAKLAESVVTSLKTNTLTLIVALDEHQTNADDQERVAIVAGPGSKPEIVNSPSATPALLIHMPQRLQDLRAEAAARGKDRLVVKFARFVSLADPHSTQVLPDSPSSSAISFSGLFSMRVRKVLPAVGTIPGLIEISGAGEEARMILKSWDKDSRLAPDSFSFVVPGAKSAPPTLIGHGVRFFTTNLSTEANPDALQLMSAGGVSPVLADISDALAMRKFLWMASVVNDTGFFASIEADAWSAVNTQLFSQSEIADISVAWLRKAFDANGEGFIARGESLVVTLAKDFPSDLGIRITVPDIHDRVSAAPAGLVSLVISRPFKENDPANPDDEVELLSRYVFLEHAVSVGGVSKLKFDESLAMPPAPPKELKLTASFSNQPTTELRYYLSVPLLQYLIPAGANSLGCPNPYMFVGKNLEDYLNLSLRDASGHRFPGKINTEWTSKIVLFRNPLSQLGTLPGLKLAWAPLSKGQLRGRLVFNRPDDFGPPADLKTHKGLIDEWQDLKFNLDTTLVQACLEVTLRDGALNPSENKICEMDVTDKLVEFVNRVLTGTVESLDKEIDIQVPVKDIIDAVKDLPREILVRLTLKRTSFVDTDAEKVNKAVAETVSYLRPWVAGETLKDWRIFADDMEKCYPEIYIAKMNRGTSGGASGSVLWIGNAKSLTAPYDEEYDIQSYAPLPLAKQFRSGTAVMLNECGEVAADAPTKDASDVDLDLLLEQSLELFENVLDPSLSGKLAAFASDSFTGIMDSKKSIVGSMIRRLFPIESKSLSIKRPKQVDRRFHSLAAKDLRNIYKIGAIVFVTRPNASWTVSMPSIYGSVSEGGHESQVEWSKIRMPLHKDSLGVVSATWKPEIRVDSAQFPSTVTPSHVEWPWPESEGEEYAPSRWLELLSARSRMERQIKLATQKVPLPLRRLPPTPKIYAHQASPSTSTPGSVSDLRRWNYQLDVGVSSELQDTFQITLDYVPQQAVAALGETRTLFDALVGIMHHRKKLNAYIAHIKSDNVSAEYVSKVAKYLEKFLADLADKLAKHAEFSAQKAVLSDSDQLCVKINLLDQGNPNRSDVALDYRLFLGSPGKRVPKVELALLDEGESSFFLLANPILGDDKTVYRYSNEVDRARQGVGGLSGMRSTLTDLDILNQPVVMPAVKVFRNLDLGGIPVNESFILESQEARTSTELVPQLYQPPGRHILISNSGKTLADQLKAFAIELFGSEGNRISVDAVASLIVPMDPTGNQQFRSPLCALKGRRADNGGSFANVFATWGGEMRAAIGSALADPQTPPLGIELSLTVYADYAADSPVLLLTHLWIDWLHLAPEQPSLLGFSMRPIVDADELTGWLYWLTGGWKPTLEMGASDITKLRERVADLLVFSPCYNHLPGDKHLPMQERDGARMAAAWRECKQIAALAPKRVKRKSRLLGWFIAPWGVEAVDADYNLLLQLLNGPLLPPVDWHLRTIGPIDSAWRAAHDPFSGKKVALVEVLEVNKKTKSHHTRKRE